MQQQRRLNRIEERLSQDTFEIVQKVEDRIIIHGSEFKEYEFKNCTYSNGSYESAVKILQQKYQNKWEINYCKKSWYYPWPTFTFKPSPTGLGVTKSWSSFFVWKF